MSNREFTLIVPEGYQGKLYKWRGGLFSTSYEAIRAAIKANSNKKPLFYYVTDSWTLKESLPLRYQTQKAFIESHFFPLLKSDDIMLEIGCAEGEFTLLMSPHVKAIQAYDFSPNLIQKAQQNLEDSKITNIVFQQGDICNLDIQGVYRAISCMGVLSYILDWEQTKLVVKKLFKALAGGGHMIYKDNTNATNEDYYFFGRRVDYWMVARSREKYIALFKEMGFKIIYEEIIHREIQEIDCANKETESYMCILQKD